MPEIRKCVLCGGDRAAYTTKFCSPTCQQEQQYLDYIKAWIAGDVDGSRGVVAVSRHVRKYIKQRDGECCRICGWAEVNPVSKTIPLHLDHIDGDWQNTRPENLRLLCPNHHALTATYGSLNRGNGRPFFVQKKL